MHIQLVAAFVAFFGFFAHAFNGANTIGASPTSTAMGGTGVALYMGSADALLKNPALLSESGEVGRYNLDFSANLVKLNGTGNYGTGNVNNTAGGRVLPEVAGSYRVNEKWAVGLGVLGVSGAASDYKGEVAIVQPRCDYGVARIIGSVAYTPTSSWSFGFSPFISYGEFALNTDNPLAPGGVQSPRAPHSALGVGIQSGITYKPMDGMILGVSYVPRTKVRYKEILNFDDFGPNAGNAALAALDDITISQPREVAVGVSYAMDATWRFALDYRNIGWSGADGFKEFGWKDQHVFALGAEYKPGAWAARVGFNYADSPIETLTGRSDANNVDLQGHSLFSSTVDNLNIFAFPGILKTHITLGGGYEFTPDFAADLAFMYAPKTTQSRSGTNFAATPYTFSTEVSLWSLALGVKYRI